MIAPNPTTPAPRRQSLRELVNFFPRQREALAAVERFKFILYGGAAGGGKSRFLRWLAVILLVRWAIRGEKEAAERRAKGETGAKNKLTGVRVGLFSVDYPTLHDRQLSKIREEFPDWLGDFNESKREFTLKPQYGGGVLCFRNLDQPSKYKSAEFAAVLVEELTENEEKVFNLLRFRLRWPGIRDTKFVGATNPGDVGHHWCKSLWIDRVFPKNLENRAHLFGYVKATALDNPYNDASYMEELQSLPDDLRRAYYEGDWDIFGNQVFSEWRREIHVCQPFKIPAHWTRWLSNDGGYKDWSMWYWMAASEDGQVFIYRERRYVETTASEQAKDVYAICKAAGERPQFIVTGMDSFVIRDRSVGKTDVDYYEAAGLSGFIEPVHGAGARASRAKTFHEYLRPYPHPNQEGYDADKPRMTARVQVFDICPLLISTLPALPMNEDHPEEVKECDIDHPFDGAGYGLQAWHARRSKAPAKPQYARGTAGDILKHAEKLGDKPKRKVLE